jgi:hypothetical protein
MRARRFQRALSGEVEHGLNLLASDVEVFKNLFERVEAVGFSW